MPRFTTATIDLTALANNVEVMRQHLAVGGEQRKIMAVVKADAYGHGVARISQFLQDKVDGFAVAFLEEALQLRALGIEIPILILEGPMSAEDVLAAHHANCWLQCHEKLHLQWLQAIDAQQRPNIWLKIDTGMHRLGIPIEQMPDVWLRYRALHSHIQVLATHLACADIAQSQHNQRQLSQFFAFCRDKQIPYSIANSAATIQLPEALGQWQRLGLALYGGAATKLPHTVQDQLQAVMTLQARIIGLRTIAAGQGVGYGQTWTATKTSQIATIAIGYADGYPRNLRTGTPVLIHGCQCPLVGRVSMDMACVDVSNIADKVTLNDTVTLWGPTLPAHRIADGFDSIDYELFTNLTSRVPRVYLPEVEDNH